MWLFNLSTHTKSLGTMSDEIGIKKPSPWYKWCIVILFSVVGLVGLVVVDYRSIRSQLIGSIPSTKAHKNSVTGVEAPPKTLADHVVATVSSFLDTKNKQMLTKNKRTKSKHTKNKHTMKVDKRNAHRAKKPGDGGFMDSLGKLGNKAKDAGAGASKKWKDSGVGDKMADAGGKAWDKTKQGAGGASDAIKKKLNDYNGPEPGPVVNEVPPLGSARRTKAHGDEGGDAGDGVFDGGEPMPDDGFPGKPDKKGKPDKGKPAHHDEGFLQIRGRSEQELSAAEEGGARSRIPLLARRSKEAGEVRSLQEGVEEWGQKDGVV